MDNQNPAIRLYNLIKHKTDEQTAQDAVNMLQSTVRGEVKNEISSSMSAMELKFSGLEVKFSALEVKFGNLEVKLGDRIGAVEIKLGNLEMKLGDRISNVELKLGNRINTLEVDMIDRINSSKFQTILWIVGVGILQVVARYLFK